MANPTLASVASARDISVTTSPAHITMIRSARANSSESSADVKTMAWPSSR